MRRRRITGILAVLGVMMMLGTLFGCGRGGDGPRVSDLTEKGACGENMTWEYSKKTKKLTITDSGDMVTTERFMWSD